ncbi:flagellar hook-basal body complex protein [Helicobacter marmotae]|uniref:Flagellar hook-basal body complex protein n=1 Tax=Helicobacter marmotae TaxID=152490 RepID=A0A3D8I2F5_9HELI|nr:flagellar hook-basal body complex protein [Helicobacter marmotae]RDU59265.1 flagellar hook-basal body complex protein [Helicobacter marmotae]
MNGTLINAYSGIKTHQFGLDSISNNIANVNTIGYRENIPQFESLFSSHLDTLNSSSPISNDMNYGANKSSNAISTRSGNYKASDGEFNIAYEGKGWFVVGEQKSGSFEIKDDGYEKKQKTYFTRDGSFTRDGEGYIVNSGGYYMYGIDLGKIENDVFSASKDEDKDFAALSSGALKPLQIPQNLYYHPVLTTKVDLSANLNKNEGAISVSAFFKDKDDVFDMQRFMDTDINAFATDDTPINAPSYNEVRLSLEKNGKKEVLVFKYGQGGEEAGEFRTFNELKKLLHDKAGLDLEVSRNVENKVDQKVSLELRNNSYKNLNIELGGSLFDKLGFKGKNESFSSGASLNFSPNKAYEKNAIVEYKNVVFIRTGEQGTSQDPFSDTENWRILDTSGLNAWSEDATYLEGDIVSSDGKIYKRTESAGNNPIDSGNWEEIADMQFSLPPAYDKDSTYNVDDIVNYEGKLYRKILDNGSSDPKVDKLGWQEIHGDSFYSSFIQMPSYQTNVEIYDESGKKFLIQSRYFMVSSGDSLSSPPKGEQWEVHSAIFDQQGEIMISPEYVVHNIEFDSNGKPSAEPVELAFGDKKITYNIAGTNEVPSSNLVYRDSGIISKEQDGMSEGHLRDIRIDKDGIIFLAFDNGAYEPMGRVGVAAFVNDQGLKKVGGNLFEMTEMVVNGDSSTISGRPILGWDGKALKFGSILYKYLETSNVDVGNALTELIVMQRGYSMNAKAFTTGDDLVKEALNLKR